MELLDEVEYLTRVMKNTHTYAYAPHSVKYNSINKLLLTSVACTNYNFEKPTWILLYMQGEIMIFMVYDNLT